MWGKGASKLKEEEEEARRCRAQPGPALQRHHCQSQLRSSRWCMQPPRGPWWHEWGMHVLTLCLALAERKCGFNLPFVHGYFELLFSLQDLQKRKVAERRGRVGKGRAGAACEHQGSERAKSGKAMWVPVSTWSRLEESALGSQTPRYVTWDLQASKQVSELLTKQQLLCLPLSHHCPGQWQVGAESCLLDNDPILTGGSCPMMSFVQLRLVASPASLQSHSDAFAGPHFRHYILFLPPYTFLSFSYLPVPVKPAL